MTLHRLKAPFPSSRTRALVLGALLVLGAPIGALAQDEGGEEQPAAEEQRAHPDISFALALGYDYQWYDLAFEVLEGLEKTRAPADVQEEGKLLRINLKMKWATTLRDPKQRDEERKKVLDDLERLAKSNSKWAGEASLLIGDLSLQQGDAAFQRMRTSEDTDARAQARAEAEKAYADAATYFEKLRPIFEQAFSKAQDEGKNDKIGEAVYKLANCCFHQGRAVYQQGLLYEGASKDRTDRITKASQLFEFVNSEYGDQFVGYEAAIFLGLCAKEMSDSRKAYNAFDSALGIKSMFDIERSPVAQDIVARASYFKAQTMNDIKDYDTALKAVEEFFELLPNMKKDPLGFAARIEEGKAWAGKGDLKKAQAVLEKVAEEAKGTPWERSAKEALTGSGPAGGLSPEKALNGAEIAISRGKVVDGLQQIRNLVAQLEQGSPEDQAKWLPVAWVKLGSAYIGERRYDEAVAAFDACASRFKKTEQAPVALYQKAMAHLQLNGAHRNDFDKSAYLETLRQLQRDYPDHEASKASAFFLGIERFAERDFLAAARKFEETGPSAGKMYDAALYQAGLAYMMEGRHLTGNKKVDEAKPQFAQARLAFQKAIDWATKGAFDKGIPQEGDRATSLRKMAFDARCRLAEIALQPAVKEPAKALDAADAAEKGLATPDPDKVAEARLLAVQAHLAADNVDKAEEVVASMSGEAPRTAQGEREVAIAIDASARAMRDQKKGDPKPLFTKAADHYARWFEVSQKAGVEISGKDLARAADRLFTLALHCNDLKTDPPDAVESFVQVDDLSKLPAAGRFATAAAVYAEAVKVGAPNPSALTIKRGECLGFTRDFDGAAKSLLAACQAEKMLVERTEKGDDGKPVKLVEIDVAVASKNTILLFAYADYARALFEQLKKNPSVVDEVIAAYFRVLNVAPGGQEIWWRSKYYLFAALYEKGEYSDAATGMRQLKRQNPGFDGNRFGLKAKFEALEASLEKVDIKGSGKGAGGKKGK